jgi:hypothetical protein
MHDAAGEVGRKQLEQRRWQGAIGLALFVVVASSLGFFCFLCSPPFVRWNPFVYIPSVSPRIVCIANLKQIDAAKETWAFEYKKPTSARPADTKLFGPTLSLREKPDCPEGGTYSLGRTGRKPRGSIPGHTF